MRGACPERVSIAIKFGNTCLSGDSIVDGSNVLNGFVEWGGDDVAAEDRVGVEIGADINVPGGVGEGGPWPGELAAE